MRKLLLLFLLVSVQSAHATQVLTVDDNNRVMRAIILTEKYFNAGDRDWKRAQNIPVGPLSPEKALGQCGDAQKMLAYELTLQGVSFDHLHFYQMQDVASDQASEEEGTGDGFLAKLAAPHAVLVYDTLDVENQPVYLFLDVTFPQFQDSVNKLNSDPIGRQLVSSIHHYGYWIADQAKLDIYASDFEMLTSDGSAAFLGTDHHSVDYSALKRDYPQMTPQQRAYNLGLGRVFGVTDGEMLDALNSITETDISLRTQIF